MNIEDSAPEITTGASMAPAPARPSKLTVEFYEEPDGLAIHNKRAGGGFIATIFLLLWLTGWTAGCVFLLAEVITKFSFGMLLFAVPFWASWVAVFCVICWMTFGRETLLVRKDESLFLRRVLKFQVSSRVVPRSEIRGFRECHSSHQENGRHLLGIEMVTLGKPVRFAFRLLSGERAWLIHRLNEFLGTSAAAITADPMPLAKGVIGGKLLGARAATTEVRASRETLTLQNTLAEAPSDTRWTLTEDFHDFTFEQRGRFHPVASAILLFINLFWNGIVSVFVAVLWGFMPGDDQPKGGEWWFLFVFLIPFQVIGLGMFCLLLGSLLDPFRRTGWAFTREGVARTTRFPFFRRRKDYAVTDLDRLELRRLGATERGVSSVSDPTASHSFALALITPDNTDLCSIPSLTEGEARWMGGVILERRREWFEGRM